MARRAKSRIANVVELFLDGLLLLCFIVQAFILGCFLAYGNLPLPAKWVGGKISGNLPEGVSIRADNYALSLNGSLRIENIRLHLDGSRQPVFDADLADLEFGVRREGRMPFYLRNCVISGGVLRMPAVYSPSGDPSAILDHIALRLLPAEGGFAVDSFAARHEDIRFRGSIDLEIDDDTEEEENLREKADVFFKQVAEVLKHKPRFDGLIRPTLFFEIDSGEDGSLNMSTRVSSRAYRHAEIQAENLTLDATLSLKDRTLVNTAPILLEADSVTLPGYQTQATHLSAIVEREDWERLLQGGWPEMEVVAETLRIEDIALESPRIRLGAREFPHLVFNGLTSGLRGAVQFSGSLNAETRQAKVRAAGSIDLLSIAPDKLARRLPSMEVKQAPYYNLSLDFNEGFVLNKAELRGRVDALEVEGLAFDHIRFRSDYKEGRYSIDRLYLHRDWQWLDLGFSFDSSTEDYALTLKGFAKPDDYNSLLPQWWEGIFRDFDFEAVEGGLGDFAIYGNTGRKAADFFFGHASVRNVGYKGLRVDEGELIVRGRGAYAEVHRLDARSGGGFVRGDIRFTSRLDEVHGPVSIRLDLESELKVTEAAKLFDDNIAAILSDLQTDARPRTSLKGAIFNDAYPEFEGRSHIDISAACPRPVLYKGLPLDYLNFDLHGRRGIIYLRQVNFGYASGKAGAEVDILTAGDGPTEARFKLSLKDAKQHEAVGRLTSLKNGPSAEPAETEAPDEGRLDFDLWARGPVANLLQMNGFGSLKIENEALHEIQLFGPLSKLLQNTRLGFTSFGLNEMKADFALEQGSAKFHKLEIDGPRTRIEAPGMMKLDDFSLAMRVSVHLFGNVGNPESNIRKIRDFVTTPIPNMLEFELTGTPENQRWRSLYDPRKFIPQF